VRLTRPRNLVILAAVACLAIAGAFAAYAFSQITKDNTTGTFSLDAEQANITVATLNAATGAADPGWTSCTRTGDAAAVGYCLYAITNDKVSGPVRISTGIESFTGNANLAAALNAEFRLSDTLTTCDGSNFDSWGALDPYPSGPISSLPFVGNPAPGSDPNDSDLAIGATIRVCMKVSFTTPPPANAFGQALTAVVRVVSDDTGE